MSLFYGSLKIRMAKQLSRTPVWRSRAQSSQPSPELFSTWGSVPTCHHGCLSGPSSVSRDTGQGDTLSSYTSVCRGQRSSWGARPMGGQAHLALRTRQCFRRRRGSCQCLPLTSSLLLTVCLVPDWLEIRRLYLFACVEEG